MKPSKLVAEAKLPDGSLLSLREHDGHHTLRVDGELLMTTRATASETAMADSALAGPALGKSRKILIGGLGFGYTLRRVLELSTPETKVVVAELIPQVVEWNRQHLQALHGPQLDDPRVEVVLGDVRALLEREGRMAWDAILLDTDNGASAMVDRRNKQLYSDDGLKAVHKALKPGGRAVYWSATRDEEFQARLREVGFLVEASGVKAWADAKRASHTLYVADRKR